MRTFLGLERSLLRRRPRRARSRIGKRIRIALAGLVGVYAFGTIGYMMMGFTALEALYQTVTTVATVGFREVHPLDSTGQMFTIVLIVVGTGIVLYNLGLLVELVTEGHLGKHLERRRMDNQIAEMRGHVIICGYGRVGRAAAERLMADGHEVVVMDRDPGRFAGLDIPHLVGNATSDQILKDAGVTNARALIATLDTDAETVYLVLSARALNPALAIVARARTKDSGEKLMLAGATRAVNPQLLGGRRLAQSALQPEVVEFIDSVMHDEEEDTRLEQVRMSPKSAYAGKPASALTSATGAAVLAIRPRGASEFASNPTPDTVLPADSLLIVFGRAEQTAQVRSAVG